MADIIRVKRKLSTGLPLLSSLKLGEAALNVVDNTITYKKSNTELVTFYAGQNSGPQGETGTQGLKGDKGDKGDDGVQGIQGERGLQGIQGLEGLQGLKGDTGSQGIQGIQGIQGLKGDTGNTGLQGIQGLKGDNGERGLKGDIGDQGIQGVQGIKGDTGLNGKSAYEIAVEEGGFVGDYINWLQSLVGLQGITGEKGDTGENGTDAPTYTQLRLNTGFPAYRSKIINIEDISCNSNSIVDVFMALKSDSENELELDNVGFSTIPKNGSFDLIVSSPNNHKIGGKFDLKYKIY